MAARQACCVGPTPTPRHRQGAAGREPEPGPPCTGPRGGECRWGGWGRSSPQLPDGEDLWPHAGPGGLWSVPRGPGTGQLVTSSQNRRLGHSRNSATSPPRRLLLGAGLVGTATLPCHLHQASSLQASKAGLSSALAHQKGFMQEAASGFRPRLTS